jgi:putative transposase
VAAKYNGSKRRVPGGPRTADGLRALVVSIAVDNPTVGYTRLRDVLRALGHEIGRTTIQELLKEQGIEPAPSRKKQMSWNQYRRAHWGAIAAWDFLTVEVLTLRGLVRYHILIVIDLASRRVEIGGIVHELRFHTAAVLHSLSIALGNHFHTQRLSKQR